MVLKKKYFPEYIEPAKQYQEFYTNNPDRFYDPGQYGGGGGPPTGGAGSPSLLDEVMAGFSPISRTLGKQPTSLQPAVPPPSSRATLGGYSNGPASLGAHLPPANLPSANLPPANPSTYNIPSSGPYTNHERQPYQYDSYSIGRQSSQYDRQSSQDLIYDRQSSQDLRYDRQSSQDLRYDRQSSQDIRYDRQSTQDLRYDRNSSSRAGYQDPQESYNPGAFSAHFAPSSRQSVSSLASSGTKTYTFSWFLSSSFFPCMAMVKGKNSYEIG